jgi:Ca-activated chloride channel family protein
MSVLAQFHFLRPLWLLALLPLALVWWWLVRRRSSDNAWREVCDAPLLAALLVQRGDHAKPWRLWLLALGWLFAVLALAGPTWSQQPQPLFQTLNTRVIVLDLSSSMAAPDLKPSRLVRARFKVADILEQTADGQTGLVVFAGDAFVVSPITQDADTISNLLSVLEPGLMPVQGSRVDLGLAKAAELLAQANISQAAVILITDGANGEPALAAARSLAGAGHSLSVLGVGTAQGAPIPNAEGELLKDSHGTIVIARLDSAELSELAQAGNGRYATMRADAEDLDYLFAAATDVFNLNAQRADQAAQQWQEQGPWLVLALLPLAALAFRRGWLLALALWLYGPPPAALAWSWDDLWLRRDQQAQRALVAGQPQRALELATDSWQSGTAAYRAGDYQRALEAFARVPGADGRYNQGNALAQLGRYAEAIAAYDAALALTPTMADAQHNRKLAEQLLQKQQQQQEKAQQQAQQEKADQPNESGDNAANSQPNEPSADQQQAAQGQNQADESQPQPSEAQPNKPEPNEAQPSEATQPGKESSDQPAQLGRSDDDALDEEEQQVLEQWLRRIPDDPGGLLRRKFLYQYQRRAAPPDPNQPDW